MSFSARILRNAQISTHIVNGYGFRENVMFKNLQTQTFMRNPAPVLADMRAEGPLVRSKIPILGKIWLTTTNAATAEVLKNDKLFTVRKANNQVIGISWWMPRMLRQITANMLSSDEPEHRRLRGIVDQAFHRREMLELKPSIDHVADDLLQALFSENEPADLVTKLARPLPLAVICELLGLPQEDRSKFSGWAEKITTVNGVISFLFAVNKLKPLTRYLEDEIERVREQRKTGLISDLVWMEDVHSSLSDDELLAMIFLLLLAGHETTTHLISGSVHTLLNHPDQLALLKEDWNNLDLAVEELLRFVSPVQTTKPRFVRENCEVQGVGLTKGDIIMPLLAASNFDPELFENPEDFDIGRKPNRHVAFGTGIHFCLGHQLARLELRSALQSLFTTYPDLKLGVPDEDIRWNERFGLRSIQHLPLLRG
ncbi:MAG: cytochrome P450 [Pseudomonadota bacterium]